MSVVSKKSKRKMNPSGRRECKKGPCLDEMKCDDVCETTPITFQEEPQPALIFPDELPSQPDFQPIENEPQHLPIDESCCPSFDSIILETVKEEVVPVLARIVSECGTKVFNHATKRWVKMGSKVALKNGL